MLWSLILASLTRYQKQSFPQWQNIAEIPDGQSGPGPAIVMRCNVLPLWVIVDMNIKCQEIQLPVLTHHNSLRPPLRLRKLSIKDD